MNPNLSPEALRPILTAAFPKMPAEFLETCVSGLRYAPSPEEEPLLPSLGDPEMEVPPFLHSAVVEFVCKNYTLPESCPAMFDDRHWWGVNDPTTFRIVQGNECDMSSIGVPIKGETLDGLAERMAYEMMEFIIQPLLQDHAFNLVNSWTEVEDTE
jgi:hypothetical protein